MSDAPSFTWIAAACSAGGTLSMSSPIPRNRMIRAKMEWPGEPTVYGEMATNPMDALVKLETALQEDAADEMVEKGAA